MSIKKFGYFILNYGPGLLILVFSMLALFLAVTMMHENESLRHFYEQSSDIAKPTYGMMNQIENDIASREKALYWSIWIMGLCGFLLLLIVAEKMKQMAKINKEREETMILLERQLTSIQLAEEEKAILQDQLHQAQKLEAVGRLAGGIAHDFNNILAAINGYAEFLVDDLPEDSAQHTFAKNITKAGDQAHELIDQILTFSRREKGEIRNMDMRIPLQETVTMLKASLPKKIKVETEISESVLTIAGNNNQIAQAIMNICVNAKDAMAFQHGTLKLSLTKANPASYDHVDWQEDFYEEGNIPVIKMNQIDDDTTQLILGALVRGYDYVALKISDTGTGIERKVMEHIFEPFFTTKAVDKGTGLGMATVHGVVASHRGAMIIDTTLGEGTTFTLMFPIAQSVENSEEASLEKFESHEEGGTILLVEDQEEVRDMMVNMLERMSYEVESCENGKAALEILREHPHYFDIILTDQNMPEMTGLELVKVAEEEFPDMPFIMLTGYSVEKMADILKENKNICVVLKKPVKRESLYKEIETILSERRGNLPSQSDLRATM